MNENAKNAQTVPPRRPAELESVPVPIVTRISPETTRISDAEADAWLGDLLAHIGRDDDALTRLAKAPSARVVPVFRTVGPKEQRVYGIFEAVECLKDGVVRLVRTANGVTRASATSLAT